MLADRQLILELPCTDSTLFADLSSVKNRQIQARSGVQHVCWSTAHTCLPSDS